MDRISKPAPSRAVHVVRQLTTLLRAIERMFHALAGALDGLHDVLIALAFVIVAVLAVIHQVSEAMGG